ncbi:unnamed protein product [Vitrella brassicaformis CCMP3155]|uniref:Serine/threonine protein phosphatase 2A regulatory subunit n=2 Tax=Vitrella brassicaformis TaxID=1169539 RepID=A0A0G4EEP7_VITBC|nr:unnamed protein product [Vitrella brassicaformis CCMP3155]|mmetsp:Transcript_49390/g.123865  ORF Transcript_49390/g.123865 Transcript_49390/m.123865 type:complete len:523 (+) Transcript_49390:292-1860(+)|eukprot:CEL94017.1 unnamed protein product [Vitrella brassicaformis CCMP3155]
MKLIQSVKRRMVTDTGANEKPAPKAGAPSGQPPPASPPSAQTSTPAPKAAGAVSPNRGVGAMAPPGRGNRNANTVGEENPFAALPALREAPASERVELFRKKLQACCYVYDFKQPDAYMKEKEAKRQTLLEIVEYVNNTRNFYNEQIMQDVVHMVGMNIFRALPASTTQNVITYDPEEEEPTLEASWPHLQIVYEFFLRFVVSNDVDPKVAKKFIDQNFVVKLLELFASEDPRERDYLKTILHRIYGKFMALRSFVRKAIQNVFYKFVYECEVRNGIAELLEILGSIINGFALPLKEEHRQFLEHSLIPLHKARTLNAFHQQLAYCMTQFVEKDPRLAETILMGLLRYWPVTNTPKEVLFLNELEEILELTQPPEFQRVMEPLFKKVAACIVSPHFQVAERVLFLWNNDYIVKLINQNRQTLFPIVIGALYKNSKHHWNNTVHGLTYNVLKLLMEADPPLFDECSNKHRESEEKQKQYEDDRARKWASLQTQFEAKMSLPRSALNTAEHDLHGEGATAMVTS